MMDRYLVKYNINGFRIIGEVDADNRKNVHKAFHDKYNTGDFVFGEHVDYGYMTDKFVDGTGRKWRNIEGGRFDQATSSVYELEVE